VERSISGGRYHPVLWRGATVLVTAYGKKNPCVVRAPHTDPQPLLPDASRPLLLLEQTSTGSSQTLGREYGMGKKPGETGESR